jgi:hypothetical protein
VTSTSRHQCLIYRGSPASQLPRLADIIRQKLSENYRCLYLNSPQMTAGVRSYLSVAGVDVKHEVDKGGLVLTSARGHLVNGRFDLDLMLRALESAHKQARKDGYQGLWATGDMSWEFGPEKDFAKLIEYEWKLEEFFQAHPDFGGVCQYHADTLPDEVMRAGLVTHPAVFVNQTLSRVNPLYLSRAADAWESPTNSDLDAGLAEIYREQAGA